MNNSGFKVLTDLIAFVSYELFRNKVWMFMVTEDNKCHYITSDNPVVVYCPKQYTNEFKKTVGISDRMVQICIPLGREVMLQMVDLKYWEGFQTIPCVAKVDEKRVHLMNELQEKNALKFIF